MSWSLSSQWLMAHCDRESLSDYHPRDGWMRCMRFVSYSFIHLFIDLFIHFIVDMCITTVESPIYYCKTRFPIMMNVKYCLLIFVYLSTEYVAINGKMGYLCHPCHQECLRTHKNVRMRNIDKIGDGEYFVTIETIFRTYVRHMEC